MSSSTAEVTYVAGESNEMDVLELMLEAIFERDRRINRLVGHLHSQNIRLRNAEATAEQYRQLLRLNGIEVP